MILAPSGAALAQTATPPPSAHPRRAEVTFLMQPAVPAVLVSETDVWAPQLPGEPLSICVPGHACVPVARRETCEVPLCPGGGARLVAATPLAEIDDFPDSLDDWKQEIDAMRQDSALTSILASYVGTHPDDHSAVPVEWVTDDDEEEVGAEFRLGLLGGGLTSQGVWFAGAEVSAGMRYFFHDDDEYDDDSLDVLDTAIGDSIELALRVAVHDIPNAQGEGAVATSLGFALSGANVIDGGRFRIASVLSAVLPEIGVFFRPDFDAAFYMRMSFPIAWAASSTVALELRPSMTLVDPWVEGGKSEVMLGVGLATIIR